ncbi:hypothetical protein AAFF_G00134110 [Aldrovandia affinis]|uniref:Uncharacterized protein n=1 Tax=Aldrovandia affinis TaxID=143900 RepID=A0AAD7RQJ0_9TELE|nr:hypothetical protein AAFF_G00134110 [Aldrovandia affinis]
MGDDDEEGGGGGGGEGGNSRLRIGKGAARAPLKPSGRVLMRACRNPRDRRPGGPAHSEVAFLTSLSSHREPDFLTPADPSAVEF